MITNFKEYGVINPEELIKKEMLDEENITRIIDKALNDLHLKMEADERKKRAILILNNIARKEK
jgi:hypothetical protein